jgi:hypothetical protein
MRFPAWAARPVAEPEFRLWQDYSQRPNRARTVVIEHGSTSWWLPLLIAVAAAAASYYATWRFKRADVNRENALRAADLVDEAEQLAARPDRYIAAPDGGAKAILHALQPARIRAQPLGDRELEDRFIAALNLAFDAVLWNTDAARVRHWLSEAIANVRSALVPHLAAPKLIRRARPVERSFPPVEVLNAMENNDDDGEQLIGALVRWRAERQANEGPRFRGLRRG